jgi:hypothetical protein
MEAKKNILDTYAETCCSRGSPVLGIFVSTSHDNCLIFLENQDHHSQSVSCGLSFLRNPKITLLIDFLWPVQGEIIFINAAIKAPPTESKASWRSLIVLCRFVVYQEFPILA